MSYYARQLYACIIRCGVQSIEQRLSSHHLFNRTLIVNNNLYAEKIGEYNLNLIRERERQRAYAKVTYYGVADEDDESENNV